MGDTLVRLAVHFYKLADEGIPLLQRAAIHLRAAAGDVPLVQSHDDRWPVPLIIRPERLDQPQPVFGILAFVVLPPRQHHDVHAPHAEEKLVQGVSDHLPGEIPDMGGDRLPLASVHHPVAQRDPRRALFALPERLVAQGAHRTRLPGSPRPMRINFTSFNGRACPVSLPK